MNPYILAMVSCLVWTVVFALVFSWTYDTNSGWDEVKALKLPFMARLRLMIPFSQKWRSDIPADKLVLVSRWRHRALIMEWGVMIPLFVATYLFFMWARTDINITMPSNQSLDRTPTNVDVTCGSDVGGAGQCNR